MFFRKKYMEMISKELLLTNQNPRTCSRNPCNILWIMEMFKMFLADLEAPQESFSLGLPLATPSSPGGTPPH